VPCDRDRPGALAYVLPRGDGTVVLGGTSSEGVADTRSTVGEVHGVLDRCLAMMPELASAELLATWAGVRPVRDPVRVATEHRSPHRVVVHNYGHGGSGLTLHWGCAEDAKDQVLAAFAATARPSL
jgi:glycine/D-amino acid oxidase-like deaminating enzyme